METITFTYSYRGLIIYEKNVTSGTTIITKHFYAGGLQVAKMVGSTTYYLHQDALGSTRLVATSSVTIKFSSNYVPYGNNYNPIGKEEFMYTGKVDDSATGLYYFGARYFDPTTGRSVTQDSYAGSKEDPMSMNRYIYARDDPERMVDPDGHMYHVMVTDFSDTNAWSTTMSCAGGTCTTTSTDAYGGYTSSVSTQVSTMTATNTYVTQDPTSTTTATVATQTTAFTTTEADTSSNDIGGGTVTVSGYVTGSDDSWTTAQPTIGTMTTKTTTTASNDFWNQVGAWFVFGFSWGVVIGAAAAVPITGGASLAAEPFLISDARGTTEYMLENYKDPSTSEILSAWIAGLTLGYSGG